MNWSEVTAFLQSLTQVAVAPLAALVAALGVATAIWLAVGHEPPGQGAVRRLAGMYLPKQRPGILTMPVVGPFLARVAGILGRSWFAVTTAELREAGWPFGMRSVAEFTGLQLAVAGLTATLLVVAAAIVRIPLLLIVIGPAVGYAAPAFVVNQRREQRLGAIVGELPLFLDALHALVTGAGTPPVQGIRLAAAVTSGPLHELLHELLARLDVGMPAQKALSEWARHSGVPALQTFAAAYAEAMTRGDDVYEMMTALAAVGRKEREHLLTAKVRKRPLAMMVAKLVPVTVLLAAALWPAVLTIMDAMGTPVVW